MNKLTDDYNLTKQEERSPPPTVDEKDAEEVAKPLDTHTEERGFYLELLGFCYYCHLIRKIMCGHPNDSEVEAKCLKQVNNEEGGSYTYNLDLPVKSKESGIQ